MPDLSSTAALCKSAVPRCARAQWPVQLGSTALHRGKMLPWLRHTAVSLWPRLSSPQISLENLRDLAGVGGTVMMSASGPSGPGAGRLSCSGLLGRSALQLRGMFSSLRFAAVGLWHRSSSPQLPLESCGTLAARCHQTGI